MKRVFHFLLAAALLLSIASSDISACTTFCLKSSSEVLFGKNYDWTIGDGMIFVNKRGVSKVSSEDANPARWVSKFGSVTFNQYGWESPSGGMNEEGLVIELMWLDDTEYPAADDHPAIDVLEWIQFNLDTAATAAQVVKNAKTVRIDSRVKLHYLVSDRHGSTATIEFLDGKLIAHTGNHLPFSVLTNDTYQRSLEYTKNAKTAAGEGSLDRFSRAASKSKEFEMRMRSDKESVDYAFDLLANVAQKHSTQWSIGYDQRRGRIYFRTRKRPELKSIDTTVLDYSCGSPVKVLDIDLKSSGDVTKEFKNYTPGANRDLIERSFSGTEFLRTVPAESRDRVAEFPQRFVCAANSPVNGTPDPRSLVAYIDPTGYLLPTFPLYHVLTVLEF
jgi:choloylglycine hydrolase